MCRAILIFLCIFSSAVLGDEFGPIIETSNGKIQGSVRKNLKGKTFHAFEGIPYALPPVGDNRFTIPREPINWTGVLAATDNSHECLQPNHTLEDESESSANSSFGIVGSEDCLYLNVYSPANLYENKSHALPVMVWIHGGAFQYRSKIYYKPNYFMDFDIIVVAINYRLGPLGFLSTHDGVIPSNLGLKDQRHALRWVSKNIKKFGGDPEKVTVAGQSAGAISISYHLLDEKNKGLFKGAILESGSALCPHDFQTDPKFQANLLASLINPDFKNSSKDLLETLKSMSSDKLMEYTYSQHFRLNNLDSLRLIGIHNVWLPVVENSKDSDIVISIPMHQALLDGHFIKIPMIAGFTSEESVGISGYRSSLKKADKADVDQSFLIDPILNIKNRREAGGKLGALYTTNFTGNPDAAITFFSDYHYITPIIRQADLIRKHAPVYLYRFSYQHSEKVKTHLPGAEKVGHYSEVEYIFGESEFSNEQDRLTHERLIKMWTNFVKFQHPTPEDDDTLTKWPITTSDLEYLDINRTLSISKHPGRYEAWKQILSEHITQPYWIY